MSIKPEKTTTLDANKDKCQLALSKALLLNINKSTKKGVSRYDENDNDEAQLFLGEECLGKLLD